MKSAIVKWQVVRRIQIVNFIGVKSLLFNWNNRSWIEREGERCYLGRNTERKLWMLLWCRNMKYVIFSSVFFGWFRENNCCGSMSDRKWQFSVSVHFLYALLCAQLNAEVIVTPISDLQSGMWLSYHHIICLLHSINPYRVNRPVGYRNCRYKQTQNKKQVQTVFYTCHRS
jgi:hypothetical protein